MKNQQKKELSNCCIAPAEVNCADEGTCCYICTKCNRACDVLVRGNKSFEEVKATSERVQEKQNNEEWEKKFNLWITNYDDEVFIQDGYYFHDDLKEHIRQQRQEAYVEGMNHAMKDNNKMVKYFEKKALREFAEYLINDPKFHIEYQHNDGYIHDVSNDIREALEVYEGK